MSSAKQTSNESISLVDTLLRLKELKQRETDFKLTMTLTEFIPSAGLHNQNPLNYTVLHTHRQQK
jgi:hypothetical protein